ncbi:MAG: hypothetical protein AAGK32_17350, partial [Actinomycetota bacterium]
PVVTEDRPAQRETQAAGDEDAPIVAERLAPTIVIDGLEIVTAADHAQLGQPDWSAVQYVFGPDDVDVPGPDDPVLLLSVADGSSGLLSGEAIEIGGHDGVIVDKAAVGTSADLEIQVGATTVQLTGRANVDLETVIAAAEQYVLWVAGGGSLQLGVPSTIGVDLTLRRTETIGAWFDADINGSLDGTTVVYAEPGTTSSDAGRRLTVSSSSRSDRSVDWLDWLHPGRTSTVDVDGVEATMVELAEGIIVLRFEIDGRLIDITATDVGLDDVLNAASSFTGP